MKTTSYKLSNKLFKLGVRVKSYMVYLSGIHAEPELIPACMTPGLPSTEEVNAYTLDEVLEMLPIIISCPLPYYNYNYQSIPVKGKDDIYISEYNLITHIGSPQSELVSFTSTIRPEAPALLLAWCVENGHVKPEEL